LNNSQFEKKESIIASASIDKLLPPAKIFAMYQAPQNSKNFGTRRDAATPANIKTPPDPAAQRDYVPDE